MAEPTSPPTSAGATLQAWTEHLQALAAAGEALSAAIVEGDVVAALAAAHQARVVRASLHRVEPGAGELEQAGPALAAAQRALIAARGAEAVVERWRSRPLPPDAELLRTPLGIACLADAMLPAVWDVETDLAVFVGPGLEPVAEILSALGQVRMMAIGAASYPTPVLTVAEATEATLAVRTMEPCPPTRLTLRGLDADLRGLADATTEAIHAGLSDLRIQRNTVTEFSRTWIAQGAANLPAIARWPSIAAVGDRFAGRPMIICAPGPSLAGNVAQLRAAKGHAIITAFSHSLRPLLAAGVVPDLVLTVDPQDVRYHFAGCDLRGVAAVVNGATVHPELFELGAARYLTLAANAALDDWMYAAFGENAQAPGGGSVATTALSLALRWRCDPVAFVGLDLSFAGGRYYVATSCDGQARAVQADDGTIKVEGWSAGFTQMKAAGGPAAPRERAIELPGYYGGTVPSSFMFTMFHRWFVEQAARVAGTVRLVNCTEGGAYIEGMAHRPLAELLAELTAQPGFDVAAILEQVGADLDPVARSRRLARHMSQMARRLRRADALAEACLRAAGQDPDGLLLAEDRLRRALAPLGWVAMLAQREIARAHQVATFEAAEEVYLAASRRLFESVQASVRTALPFTAAAARALAVRGRVARGGSHGIAP